MGRNLRRDFSVVVYDLAATPSATPQQIAAAAAAACVLFTLVDLISQAKELLLASYFRRRCNSCKQLMCSEFAVFGKPRSTQLVYTQRGNTLRVGLQLGPFSISSSDVLF